MKIEFQKEHELFVVFEIYEVKDRPVLAPKIPYYVTYAPKLCYVQIDMLKINLSYSIIDYKMFMF